MKKLLAAVFVAALSLAGATVVKADPGPHHGNNAHGLCTAYFNGQKKGHDKNGQPGPFQALEDTAREHTDQDGRDNDKDGDVDEENENQDISAEENVFNFCDDVTTIGGNPEHGRFDCDRDPAADSDPDCQRNPAPGNSDKS